MLTVTEVLVADEAWIALASLHRRHPERASFSAAEIMESANREKAHPEPRAGLQPHIYLHNVANLPPNSARYRMFYKVAGGTYRLFRPGDDFHPDRKGKAAPHREELPAQYVPLLDWYEQEYSRQAGAPNDDEDPVLQMWGVGKEIWKKEDGDAFIARERAALDDEMRSKRPSRPSKTDSLKDRVWKRIVAHEGAEFRTVKDLPFTHSVEGNGIWFYREGKRVPTRLWRGEVNQAISICPVGKPTELKDFRDPSYLYGLLMDPRIRSTDW
jgi:hypothetical protein